MANLPGVALPPLATSGLNNLREHALPPIAAAKRPSCLARDYTHPSGMPEETPQDADTAAGEADAPGPAHALAASTALIVDAAGAETHQPLAMFLEAAAAYQYHKLSSHPRSLEVTEPSFRLLI